MSTFRAAIDSTDFAHQPRTYGKRRRLVQHFLRLVAGLGFLALAGAADHAAARTVRIVVLGDSLSAGYQLPASSAFPARLQRALHAKGYDVEVTNAGASGDTALGGLMRLDWSVPEGTDAVIVELGANDMLRGVDPTSTRKSLESIVQTLKRRDVEVLLAGMRAAPNLGAEYRRAFDAMYPNLAASYAVVFYPFFLDGVATDPKYNLGDRIHPNAAGVDLIVERILPKVVELIRRVQARH